MPDRERKRNTNPEGSDSGAAMASLESERGARSAAAKRMERHTLWADLQVRRAIERGDFDDLPGAGKPIPGLGGRHDPDWWVKGLIEREHITEVLPAALALRKEDQQLNSRIDTEPTEQAVRELVGDFNQRVIEARRQLQGGPPVITPLRDVDAEVAAWRRRRSDRQQRHRGRRPPAT